MIRAKSDKSVTVAFIVPSNNKERIFRPQTLTIIPRPWDTRTGSPTDLRFSSSTSTTPEAENRDLCCHTYSARMTLHGQTNMPIVILFNVLIATRNFAHVAVANRPRAPSVRRTRSPLRLARDQSPPVVQKPAEQADVQRRRRFGRCGRVVAHGSASGTASSSITRRPRRPCCSRSISGVVQKPAAAAAAGKIASSAAGWRTPR
jgi:hypothetical protein